ncbi:LacI family DNA-binding transcriptional regulator [Arthrobacter sp. ZBG10]|uniref:LacI family DNA-binding transcriptional regulator n=1 Tax=Arthrobacter sp. ZBG10 TaxID=1676590 RepID=UPI000681A55C|nr:LacI family DNA-binding transcriptional regulator [Arthrobacter sp. ZBG10]
MVTTSHDVARGAGVSRSTVSEILNGRGHKFATATREKVEQVARELGYQPSAAARTLVRGTSDLVIALIPDTTFGGNLQDIFERATEELAQHGLTLVLRLATHSPQSFDRLISSLNPRGVLSLTPFTAQERQILQTRGVEFFDPVPPADHHSVDYDIGRLQASHLISRGHTRLAYAHLSDTRQDPFGADREQGVRDECRDHNLPTPLTLKLGINREEALAALDSMGQAPFAIACYNDDVATALVAAAQLRGRTIPHDVALIGVDNTPLSQIMIPQLSTIGYPIGGAAHAAIANIIANTTTNNHTPNNHTIPLHIIHGETT